MAYRWLIFCLLGIGILAIPGVASAQFLPFRSVAEGAFEEEEDEIVTDRDSFTPATSVVGYHRTIVESAYSFIDNRHVAETHSVPELITRWGMTENIELHLGWNWEAGGAGNPITGNVSDAEEDEPGIEKESKILYGAKFYLTDQSGWTPESSLIVQGFTPTSGEANDSNLSTTYVAGWTLPNRCVWDSALRFSTSSEEEDHFKVWAPSTVLKVPIHEKWNAHAEYFGVFTEGRDGDSVQHFFSPGLHYTMTPNFEIGVRVGWGLNEQSPNFFSNAGIGVRF